MGSDLNLPKSLTQLSAPPPPQPLEQSQKSNMPMLYYGLVIVATAAIVLAIYNLLIVRWCTNQYRRSREEASELVFRRSSNTTNTRNNNPQSSSLHHGDSTIGLTTTSSFRYRKGIEEDANSKALQLEYDMECSVCLSVFEEGEEVKKLPRCNHWFHAACIDMWLYSHADCPLCRAPVLVVDPSLRHPDSENSRDGLLLDTSTSSV